jgi:hypothetical protein
LLGISVIIAFFYISAIVQIAFDKPDKDTDSKKNGSSPLSLFLLSQSIDTIKQIIKEKRWKSFLEIFLFSLNILLFFIGLFVFIFFFGYIFHFINRSLGSKTIFSSTTLGLFIYGIGWFLIFHDLLSKTFKQLKELINTSLIIILILFSIGLIKIENEVTAGLILNGKPITSIEFDFKELPIKSTDTFVYVGKTENYVIMRDLKENKNYIFPCNKIGRIVQRKK